MPPDRRKLGEILLEMGAIDDLQLKSALAHHEQWGQKTGKALVEMRFCSEDDVTRGLALQSGFPLVDLDKQPLDSKLLPLVPLKIAEKLGVVPLRIERRRHETLVFAAIAPATLATLDTIRTISGKANVSLQLASDSAMERAIGFLYHGKSRDIVPPPVVPLREVQIQSEATFDLEGDDAFEATPAPAPPPMVLLFGWHDARAKALATMLKMANFESRPLSDDALDSCSAADVIIASTLSLQSVLPAGTRIQRGKLIICGMSQDSDSKDAQALGARVYLRPPFSPEQLARAIQQLG